jgi:copper chaperone CopZ
MAKLVAHSNEISCEGCANAIRRALGRLEGVQEVSVDVPAQDITVQYDDAAVQPAHVLEKLSRAGYDSTLRDAPLPPKG